MNEKVSTTKERLAEIMAEEGLRQSDIIDLCQPLARRSQVPITRSDVSSWCTGRSTPNQKKMYVLANSLHVTEAWLMGLNASKYPHQTISDAKKDIELLSKVQNLSERDRKLVMEMIDYMSMHPDIK